MDRGGNRRRKLRAGSTLAPARRRQIMAGDGGRRGAIRKAGSKKGPAHGTGGHGRRALEGKGATPKAEDRPYHPAAKRKQQREAAARRRGKSGARSVARHTTGHLVKPQRAAVSVVIAGGNAVLEAVAVGIAATTACLEIGIAT